MFVFALCLVGTALALPAIPPAPILPIGGDVIFSGPEGIVPYGMAPIFNPFRTLEFKIEEEPKEFNEEKEELEFEKKEEDIPKVEEEPKIKEEPKTEEEPRTEEEPKTEEEHKKIFEFKPETVFVKLEIPKPPAFIGNLLSYLPFSLPPSISNWFNGRELPTRYLYPEVPDYRYVIYEKPRA